MKVKKYICKSCRIYKKIKKKMKNRLNENQLYFKSNLDNLHMYFKSYYKISGQLNKNIYNHVLKKCR